MSYDRWLEQPYIDRAADEDAYEKWCEREGLDPAEDHYDDFRDAMAESAEDAALERAEHRAAMEDDR